MSQPHSDFTETRRFHFSLSVMSAAAVTRSLLHFLPARQSALKPEPYVESLSKKCYFTQSLNPERENALLQHQHALLCHPHLLSGYWKLSLFEFFLFLRWVLPVLSWSGTRWFPKNLFWSLLDMSCSGSCHFSSCHKICFAKKVAQVSVRTERTWLLEQCVVSWFQPLCSDMTAGQVEKTGYPYPHFENKL